MSSEGVDVLLFTGSVSGTEVGTGGYAAAGVHPALDNKITRMIGNRIRILVIFDPLQRSQTWHDYTCSKQSIKNSFPDNHLGGEKK
jgi:hypothetical protein